MQIRQRRLFRENFHDTVEPRRRACRRFDFASLLTASLQQLRRRVARENAVIRVEVHNQLLPQGVVQFPTGHAAGRRGIGQSLRRINAVSQDANRLLARRAQHLACVIALGLVDELLALFERVGDLPIRRHDLLRRMNIEQVEVEHLDPDVIRRHQLTNANQATSFDLTSPIGQQRIERFGRRDFTEHAFGDGSQRVVGP